MSQVTRYCEASRPELDGSHRLVFVEMTLRRWYCAACELWWGHFDDVFEIRSHDTCPICNGPFEIIEERVTGENWRAELEQITERLYGSAAMTDGKACLPPK